jgi:hypothetical protein
VPPIWLTTIPIASPFRAIFFRCSFAAAQRASPFLSQACEGPAPTHSHAWASRARFAEPPPGTPLPAPPLPVAAVAVGIQGSTVSILCADPAFKELLAFYRSETDAAYRSLHEELSGISMDAAAEIRKRLEDDEMVGKMSLDTLTELVKMGADRTGFGPQSKSTNVNVTVDFGARLEAARKRVAERKVIDVTPGAEG